MKKLFVLCFLLLLTKGIQAQVSLISIDSLLTRIRQTPDSGSIVVYNFWATWCKPCVEELPLFSQADSILKAQNVQFVFVNFDGPSELKKVKKFSKAKSMIGMQYVLNAYDLNTFIPAVDRRWQGNIPYSIVLKYGKRKNHEFNFESLNDLLYFINN